MLYQLSYASHSDTARKFMRASIQNLPVTRGKAQMLPQGSMPSNPHAGRTLPHSLRPYRKIQSDIPNSTKFHGKHCRTDDWNGMDCC